MFIALNYNNYYNYEKLNSFIIKTRVVVLHGLAKANGRICVESGSCGSNSSPCILAALQGAEFE
jgi:hypothetical protein